MKSMKKILYCVTLLIAFSFSCNTIPTEEPFVRDEETINLMTQYAEDSNDAVLVTLKLVGETVPGKPKVTIAEDSASVIFERMGISLELAQTSPDTWITLARPGVSYVIGWIAENQALFGYCSEPFAANNDTEVTFSPGMPLTLEYDLTNVPEEIITFPVELTLPIKTFSKGNETFLSWGEEQTIEAPCIVKIEGLARGSYKISAITVNYSQYIEDRIPFFIDKRIIEIKSDSNNNYAALYPIIDNTVEPGDVTVHGYLFDPLKQPMADTIVQLIPFYGSSVRYDLYYPETSTDSNGWFEFTGIRPDITVATRCFNAGVLMYYDIMKENAVFDLDMVVNSNMYRITAGEKGTDFIIDFKDKQSTLYDFLGKTVVITLWADWSTAGKQAITELDNLAERYAENEDIVFIALNLDADRTVWEKAVESAGWKNLLQGWYNQSNNKYAFNRIIPSTFIIDSDGILIDDGYNLDIASVLEKDEQDEN